MPVRLQAHATDVPFHFIEFGQEEAEGENDSDSRTFWIRPPCLSRFRYGSMRARQVFRNR